MDVTTLADALAPVLKELVADAEGRMVDLVKAQGFEIIELRTELAALKAVPAPKDGRDGVDGVPGEKGEPGERGADGAPGIDGKEGPSGRDGIDGLAGKDGAAGLNGKDGASIGGGVIDRDGVLQVTLTDGKVIPFGVVVGKDGKDFDQSEIAALRSAIDAMQTGKVDNDLSDREFERRVEAALAESQVEVVRDAVVGAMREAPRPTINVSVPITMPRRGKEIMTVEHDAKGRIKRSIKEEVD